MEKKAPIFTTRQITTTAALLAICIVSQLFKNLSIFITGPIINVCLALAVVLVGLPCGIALSLITPITAYFIAASPVMLAVPGILPLIMGGNLVLVLAVHFLMKEDVLRAQKGFPAKSYVMAVVSAGLKGAFMGLTISLWLLPTFLPQGSPLRGKLSVFQTTFSLYQFLTALIGFVYFFVILLALKPFLKNEGKGE